MTPREKNQRQKGLTCSADGCDAQAFSKGMCRRHYQAEYRRSHKDEIRQQKRDWDQRVREDARKYRELQKTNDN